MYSFEKVKQLWENIISSKLKGENPDDFENSNIFNEKDKKDILFSITNKSEERAQFINKLNKQKVLESIKGSKEPKSKVKQMYWLYTAAASIVVLLGVTIFFNKNNQLPIDNQPVIVDNNIEIGTDKATLILEDGSNILLEKGTSFQTSNANSNGEEIIYQTAEQVASTKATAIKKMTYNTLAIPRGGQFHIQLSDGTKVWLNSESQLKYPVAFVKGETRQVELVYGEAYFDVSPSTEHNGAKFKVFNQSQEVEVLGTEFNIKAYKDETNIYTTLVEGRVSVSTSTTTQILAPNQQLNLDVTNNKASVASIDVKNEISWIKGEFRLQDKTLKEIMKVLSRWYDMEVEFTNKDLEEARFVGVLGKSQNIVDILNNLKETGDIKDYEINNKKVTLK